MVKKKNISVRNSVMNANLQQKPKLEITESVNFYKPSFTMPHALVQGGFGRGEQKFWRYKNGYGASAVRFWIKMNSKTNLSDWMPGSYGSEYNLWELAVLKFEGKNKWKLCYDTKITSDVMGHLTEQDVEGILIRIKELKNAKETKRQTRKKI